MAKSIQTSFSSPSNIAFVKYWGKTGIQIPLNPSLSMTLKNCKTSMDITASISDTLDVKVFLDSVETASFIPKIESFLEKTKNYFSFINTLGSITIESTNTFPHSSGIASSASAFSCLAKCFCDLEEKFSDKTFSLSDISSIARLGSGSACRSLEGPFVHWGKESTQFASKLKNVNSKFETLCDAILIIDKGEKSVSSSAGHALMDHHPMKDARVKMANENFNSIILAMETGDIQKWGDLVELEALSLHAIMMSSSPSYILLKPGSIEAINLIRHFREDTQIPLYFTIDAGANIHVLYFASDSKRAEDFIHSSLAGLCEDNQVIWDHASE